MTVIHRVTGYDKRTELLEVEYDVPEQKFSAIREIVQVPLDDPQAVGSYPLDADAVQQVGRKLDRVLSADAYDWFLEPFAEPN
jgi:hypothetical protein